MLVSLTNPSDLSIPDYRGGGGGGGVAGIRKMEILAYFLHLRPACVFCLVSPLKARRSMQVLFRNCVPLFTD